jgi:glucose-1-phosphate cytidylyltransferase
VKHINPKDIPVVILCGGEGARFREETQRRPKAMIEVGRHPIIWHIMQTYMHYGFNRFILCLGYKGDVIKNYFLNMENTLNDFTLDLNSGKVNYFDANEPLYGNIVFAETGAITQTGARVKRIQKYIDSDYFMLTYGDGLANINIRELLDFHLAEGRIGTITGVNAISRFGELAYQDNRVTRFIEKPEVPSIINGGFFVFHRNFFDYLDDNEDCILEKSPLENLVRDNQLSLFRHYGFWQCMDTFKDYSILNNLCENGKGPWSNLAA